MRKITYLLISIMFVNLSLFADPYSDFKKEIQTLGKTYLKPFVKDFGGVLGATDFNSGRNVGFPGFDVGFDFSVQSEPSSDNKILRNAGVDKFGVPIFHAVVGLPFTGLDVGVRGFSYSGLSIVGGNLRYKIFKSGMFTKFMPDLSVMAFYDVINYDYFKGNHMSFDLVASWDLPVIKPFIGGGIDRTKLEIKDVDATLNGVDESTSEMRYSVGLKFSPLPLVYIYAAYTNLHGETAYNGGLGARF